MILKTTILVLTTFSVIYGEQFVINFKVLHEAIVDCPDKGTDEIQLKWKLIRFNRTTQLMAGHIIFNRTFDDSMSMRVKLWTWKNGGWKAGTGFDFKKDRACSSLTTVLGPVWTAIADKAHFPPKCPYRKGSYFLDNLDARVWDKLPLPGAPVNKYKLAIIFATPDGVYRGCYSSIYRVAKK